MLKIVELHHIDYKLHLVTTKKNSYYFKTEDDVKINDYVYCDTENGLMVCVVKKIYTSLEEIIKLNNLPLLSNIKDCRTTLDLPDLPF